MLVSLENLLRIGQLKEHPVDAGEIARPLAAAERGVADARVASISPETRKLTPHSALPRGARSVSGPRKCFKSESMQA